MDGKSDSLQAMSKASLDYSNASDISKCLFVDDSLSNVRAAKSFGWKSSVWFREKLSMEKRAHLVSGDESKIQEMIKAPTGAYAEALRISMEGGDGKATTGVDAVVSGLEQLREVWPFIFLQKENDIETTEGEIAPS